MILVIDNYDSFTYNLVQYIGEMREDMTVLRNDEVTIEQIETMDVDGIVISPGPGHPKDAGVCIDVIQHFKGKVPIFGVCLGHQAIGLAFGGKVSHAKQKMHGKISPMLHEGEGVFKGISQNFSAARYHSLIVENENLPEELKVTAVSEGNEIMGLQHKELPIYGIQFHPESIFTQEGKEIIKNFLEICG